MQQGMQRFTLSRRALIEAYLKLEAQRLGFTYKIHVEDVQESFATRYIPSLIVHPIVENAIKHAMGPMGEVILMCILEVAMIVRCMYML